MASIASCSTSALHAVACHAPCVSTKIAVKPAQIVSYSLLTCQALTGSSCRPTSQAAQGVKTLNFAGTEEVMYEWDYFKNDTLALIGYGLNTRDNGLNVIIGVRKDSESWQQAIEDGWVPGEMLFPIEEAINQGTIIMNLLSDAAQSQMWPTIAPLIIKGKTLYFLHSFSVVCKEDTKVIPPEDVDVILVASKGSSCTVCTLFKEGCGINSSMAVFQDVTGHVYWPAKPDVQDTSQPMHYLCRLVMQNPEPLQEMVYCICSLWEGVSQLNNAFEQMGQPPWADGISQLNNAFE
ncbi:NAD(P)-binding protein [Suillus hirtellus]|nr:NAD(P)-binding protein [Suillus hirtellus]